MKRLEKLRRSLKVTLSEPSPEIVLTWEDLSDLLGAVEAAHAYMYKSVRGAKEHIKLWNELVDALRNIRLSSS